MIRVSEAHSHQAEGQPIELGDVTIISVEHRLCCALDWELCLEKKTKNS